MALELFVSRRASREIERVVEWWAVNRPAAPGAVHRDLKVALDLLRAQPDIGMLYFPYGIRSAAAAPSYSEATTNPLSVRPTN